MADHVPATSQDEPVASPTAPGINSSGSDALVSCPEALDAFLAQSPELTSQEEQASTMTDLASAAGPADPVASPSTVPGSDSAERGSPVSCSEELEAYQAQAQAPGPTSQEGQASTNTDPASESDSAESVASETLVPRSDSAGRGSPVSSPDESADSVSPFLDRLTALVLSAMAGTAETLPSQADAPADEAGSGETTGSDAVMRAQHRLRVLHEVVASAQRVLSQRPEDYIRLYSARAQELPLRHQLQEGNGEPGYGTGEDSPPPAFAPDTEADLSEAQSSHSSEDLRRGIEAAMANYEELRGLFDENIWHAAEDRKDLRHLTYLLWLGGFQSDVLLEPARQSEGEATGEAEDKRDYREKLESDLDKAIKGVIDLTECLRSLADSGKQQLREMARFELFVWLMVHFFITAVVLFTFEILLTLVIVIWMWPESWPLFRA